MHLSPADGKQMILFYCSDIEERRKIHGYFRDKGIFIEAVPLSEFEAATYRMDATAVLLAGNVPPGFMTSFDPSIPVITVGRYQIGHSVWFRDYSDIALFDMLKELSGVDDCYEYNDILFAKGDKIIYLGYPLRLTPSERALLAFLVKNREYDVSARQLTDACLGDIHLHVSNVSKHISAINRKAELIGGRKMIISPLRGHYRINKYI